MVLKRIYMYTIVTLLFSTTYQTAKSKLNYDFYFNNRVVNLGIIPLNRNKTVVVYELYNKSQNNVWIKQVKSSCGCTTVNYSKNIVKPRERRKIYVTVSTKYKNGYFSESVLIRLSDNTPHILRIKGNKLSQNTD